MKPYQEVAKYYLDTYKEFKYPWRNTEDQTDLQHLAWMLVQIEGYEMSETKANRWLGYVQGVMVMKGLLFVEEERDRTRGIFKGE